ncbi:MAG: efflux transporter outer membrane subunit [Burkholderiales bacterium]|nr:efflux transporter outer membrane subunit [Burkholderiales bacterium]
MKKSTLTLVIAGVLAGCSMTPEYVRPEAPVATTFPADTAGKAAPNVTRIASDIGWREFFTDARLQSIITAALDNNRDLRTAALRIEEARAQYNIQSADLLPTINATATGSRARVPGSLNSTGTSIVTSSYQVGLSLASFELDFFGRVRSLNEAALSQYLATEEARRAAHISLIAEVAKAYLAERAFTEQLALAQRTLVGREKGYSLAKQRFDVGASSALDLRANEALVAAARVAVATLTRQRVQAANALTLLIGKPLTDLPAAQALSSQNIVTELPAGLPSDLLTNRPDIRAAEERLKASNANIGAARAAFFPRISLTASLGTSSNALSGLLDAGSRSWTFAPQLVLPIFDYGRNSGNLTLAEVRKNIAVADYEKTIQVAFREVADALAARGALTDQIEAQRVATEAQAERLRLSDLRFKNGVASSLDVLDAERELFNAEQALVQARLLRLTNAIDLYRALGGGLREKVESK